MSETFSHSKRPSGEGTAGLAMFWHVRNIPQTLKEHDFCARVGGHLVFFMFSCKLLSFLPGRDLVPEKTEKTKVTV